MATLDTLGLAEGPYAPYIRLFVEWKMGKGLKLTDNLACACRSYGSRVSTSNSTPAGKHLKTYPELY